MKLPVAPGKNAETLACVRFPTPSPVVAGRVGFQPTTSRLVADSSMP